MRKVIVSMNVTLDGFLSDPHGGLDWHFSFWNEEMSACATEQLSNMDTIMIGRVTYETMAGYWPTAPRGCLTDLMNNHSKVVVSRTLPVAGWTNTRVVKSAGAEISSLQSCKGKDIIVYGSSTLVSTLMQLGLIDEYRIWVHPVVIGSGVSLFGDQAKQMNLRLLRSKTFGTGVILLYYQPLTTFKPA